MKCELGVNASRAPCSCLHNSAEEKKKRKDHPLNFRLKTRKFTIFDALTLKHKINIDRCKYSNCKGICQSLCSLLWCLVAGSFWCSRHAPRWWSGLQLQKEEMNKTTTRQKKDKTKRKKTTETQRKLTDARCDMWPTLLIATSTSITS